VVVGWKTVSEEDSLRGILLEKEGKKGGMKRPIHGRLRKRVAAHLQFPQIGRAHV